MLQKDSQECTAAIDHAKSQDDECENDQAKAEEFYCSMKAKRDEACGEYDHCFKVKIERYDRMEKTVRELEAHTKESYQRLTCFANILTGDDLQCDPAAVDSMSLDVTYPEQPTKQECIALVKTRQDYSKVDCLARPDGVPGPYVQEDNETKATPAPETPTTPPASSGWYDGGEEQSCTAGCAVKGLVCTEEGLSAHN